MPTREQRAKSLGVSIENLPADTRGRHNNHARGRRCARWNDARKIATTGHVKVRVGKGHPLSDPNGYAYEHLLVWVSAGNLRPNAGFVLHHVNGDKTDNRIENLQLMTRAEHNAHHMGEMERDGRTGRIVGKHKAFPEVRP